MEDEKGLSLDEKTAKHKEEIKAIKTKHKQEMNDVLEYLRKQASDNTELQKQKEDLKEQVEQLKIMVFERDSDIRGLKKRNEKFLQIIENLSKK